MRNMDVRMKFRITPTRVRCTVRAMAPGLLLWRTYVLDAPDQEQVLERFKASLRRAGIAPGRICLQLMLPGGVADGE